MSRLLRKLEKKVLLEIPLKNGELQADALKSFSTRSNSLSVFRIENDGVSMERILAAIAGGRDHLQEVDYAVFLSDELGSIVVHDQPGDTADEEVNRFHLNLAELSAEQVLMLAKVIQRNGKFGRLQKQTIKQELRLGLETGKLQRDKLKKGILEAIEGAQ